MKLRIICCFLLQIFELIQLSFAFTHTKSFSSSSFSSTYEYTMNSCTNNYQKDPRNYQNRKLYIFTVQSGNGVKYHRYMSSWKLSLETLVNSSNGNIIPHIINTDWKGKTNHKYLTKPLAYYNEINKIINITSINELKNTYVMLVDSDILWSNITMNILWNKYECIRNNYDIIVSSELNCWIGRYCTHDDLMKYYSKPSYGYSIFLNSGAIIGKISLIQQLLHTITINNTNYYLDTYTGYKYDDQYAFTKYFLTENPIATIDIHQELFGTFQIYNTSRTSIHGYICKVIKDELNNNQFIYYLNQSNTTNLLSSSSSSSSSTTPSSSSYPLEYFYSTQCLDNTKLVFRNQALYLNRVTCNMERNPNNIKSRSLILYDIMSTLSQQPILWHGNGGGKHLFYLLKPIVEKCLLNNTGLLDHYICDDNGCHVTATKTSQE